MKQTTGILLAFLLCFAGTVTHAQNKDCKFTKGKNDKGKAVQMIASPSKVGNFYVWKDEDKYFMSYSTKIGFILLGSNEADKTELRVDSVDFYFDGNKITLPAKGKGDIKNEANKLKYTFEFVQFQVSLDPAMVTKLTTAKLEEIYVQGEKEASYRDIVTERQQDKLLAAFNCL